MTGLLLFMGFIVVLGFATYLRLPLTSVFMVSLAALAFSMRAHQEPLYSILNLFKVPALVISSLGSEYGFRPEAAAVAFLGITFVVDLALTSALGWRRKR